MVLTCASGTKHYYDAPSSSQQICSLPSSSATWVQAPSFALAYWFNIAAAKPLSTLIEQVI